MLNINGLERCVAGCDDPWGNKSQDEGDSGRREQHPLHWDVLP